MPTPEFLSRHVHAVKGGVIQVLWAEQFWNGHPRKLDRKIFEDCPSAKFGPLENFPLRTHNARINPSLKAFLGLVILGIGGIM